MLPRGSAAESLSVGVVVWQEILSSDFGSACVAARVEGAGGNSGRQVELFWGCMLVQSVAATGKANMYTYMETHTHK